MELFEAFLRAFSYLTDPVYWIALAVAVVLAAISGLIPGMSSMLVMAIAIPFVVLNITDPVIGLVLLAAIVGVANTLDSIPAVLVGMPAAATQVTFLEGHQLARRGRAAHTLGAVYAVSAIGGVIGALCLLIAIPFLRPFILSFSYSEIAAAAIVGLAFIAMLSRGAILKSLAAATVGLLFGTIGIAPATGTERFIFEQLFLWGGLPLIPIVLGLFALPELIDLMMTRRPVASAGADVSIREVLRGFLYGVRQWKMTVRQSIFGVICGAVPGIGSSVVDWLAYAFGILFRKDKREFGKGSLDGVLFAESAQNAKEGGQAVPTLSLGVPGGAAWALVIAAMNVYGLAPGPQMVGQFAHVTMLLVITLALGNLAVALMGVLATPWLARLTLVPYPAIGSIVIPIVLIASFLSTSDWSAIPIAMAAGVFGLFMKHYGWPRPPLFIAFILGPIIEKNLISALSAYGGFWAVLTRPFTLILILLAAVVAIGFTWFMSYSTEAIEEVTKIGAEEAFGSGGHESQRKFQLRGEHLFAFALIGLACWTFWASLEFPGWDRLVPQSASSGVVLFICLWFGQDILLKGEKPRTQILDLGLLSSEVEGAHRIGLIVLALFAGFSLLATLFGIPVGALAFAVTGPLLLMKGRPALLASFIAIAIVAGFVVGIADYLIGAIWPSPLVGALR